jgi:protein-disulfide isomerase
MKRYLPFVIIALVLLAAIGSGAYLLRSSNSSNPTTTTTSDSRSSSSSIKQGADPPHTKGEPNAAVTIEEFGDFQCPPCGAFYPELKKLKAEYGTNMRVIFRHFPLTEMHPQALDAALAAEAAAAQGKFWEMHDWLYENQALWDKRPNARELFVAQARTFGLNPERFERDMNAAPVKQRVSQDYYRGISLGVTGTPTIFINGRQVAAKEMTPEGLRQLINSALNKKG